MSGKKRARQEAYAAGYADGWSERGADCTDWQLRNGK